MTFVVLAVLAIVWIGVIGSYLRERMVDRRRDTVLSFRSQLQTLERARPGTPAADRRASRRPQGGSLRGFSASIPCEIARQRRKNILLGLLAIAPSTVLVALVITSPVTVTVALLAVAALGGYVGLLANRQRIIEEQRAKVRTLSVVRSPQHMPGSTKPTSARTPALVASSRR